MNFNHLYVLNAAQERKSYEKDHFKKCFTGSCIVGTAEWRLPIYHYDDYENWEVMQYYDIPSRYEIPSAPETITEEAAGTVYYSEPNRILLFYGDAEVSGEYTPVGYFDNTDEFRSAVENNPVLEGWGNKIVRISDGN